MPPATAAAPSRAAEPRDAVLPVGLLGEAPASPAGPLTGGEPVRMPTRLRMPRALQLVRINWRQARFMFRARREVGEIFGMYGPTGEDAVVTSHPDHVRSLFTADPALAPSLTGESPLRPIVGPNSVLTLLGPEHMRQRKLLLPSFHGEAVERYTAMIAEAAEREIDRWPVGQPFALGPAMQAITLDVIMSGIFGVEGTPAEGTPERDLRETIRAAVALSSRPSTQFFELLNIGRREPIRIARRFVENLERPVYAAIAARRAAGEEGLGDDVFSLLLKARYEDGEPMSDQELRDELLTLVLAGHETTANTLAWAFERLLRTPAAYERLREEVRAEDPDAGADYVEATIHEAMRVRPVIPLIGRRVTVPWQLGEYSLPADTPVLISILLLHHREDLYPEPYAFLPERFLGAKPGTYTWIPFGGGIRRCLGATLAMAEQRVVLRAIAARTDLAAVDPAPEPVRHRNVTMVPAHGTRVVLESRRAAA
ncbi:MAG TPA: cytochrome P450 [Solirubrobacteraceae bacterium]|nr:cytochrome P450 [Solirubrobacteraceae bacterium]